jgi:hypothetical protein
VLDRNLGTIIRVTFVATAIRDARIERVDDRGLMPLAEARAWLAGRTAYAKGEGTMVGDRYVLESDLTWAALLSLDDGDEFVGQARRLDWRFHVRGRDNVAPHERYGDAILPWLADRVDADGLLHNVPWCVLPCLMASGSAGAFAIAARVRSVTEALDDAPPPSTLDTKVLCGWVTRHAETGYRLLGERARTVDAAADHALATLHAADPRGVAGRLTAAIGPAAADAVLNRLGLVAWPLPATVRAVLDAAPTVAAAPSRPLPVAVLDHAFEEFDAPMWDNANYFCAAMRLIGFVNPGGTDGLVFQSLVTGLGESSVRISQHRYGFDRPAGTCWGEEYELVDEASTESFVAGAEVYVALPNGSATVKVEPHPFFGENLGPTESVMLALSADRAGLDRCLFDVEQLRARLDLPATAQSLFTVDTWRHPAAGLPASGSEDLILAVEALRERRAISSTVTNRSREEHLRDRIDHLGGWGADWDA